MAQASEAPPAVERGPSPQGSDEVSLTVDAPHAEAGARMTRLGPALAALATFALHAACWGRYALFRDELYFLVCGQRLSAGYVDQPPGVALVARLAYSLFGTWVPGVRVFSWIAGAATVYLAGRLAARISGSAAAATLASVAAFGCFLLLGVSHLLSMNAFEPLLILGVVHVLLRLSQGEDPRLWVTAGGLAGLAVLVKYTAAPLVLALLLGFAVTSARRALRTPWALAGAALGALIVLPNLVWQATHGYPFLEMVHAAVTWKNTPTTPLQFLGGLLDSANPLNAPLWVGGLAWLLIAPKARAARFVGVGALVQLLALAFGQAKPYYATAVLPMLLAGGAVALVALCRFRAVQWTYGAAVAALMLAYIPLTLPILPIETFVRYQEALGRKPKHNERGQRSAIPGDFADQFGWPEVAAGVARVYKSLPPEEQARAVVLGLDYGVASAVEILGPDHGLPRGIAISGHNQFWFWGVPAGRGDPILLVAPPGMGCPKGIFREAVLAEQLPTTPYAMAGDNGNAVWICRGLPALMRTMPPELRHFE